MLYFYAKIILLLLVLNQLMMKKMDNSSIKASKENNMPNQICPICNKKISSSDKIIKNKKGKLVHFNCLMSKISDGIEITGIGFGNR